ncbi:MAG: transaminase [Steroidobacteraceae bacterium]
MIDPAPLLERERRRFAASHPRSARLAQRSGAHFLNGVPMHWMADWGTPHPLFLRQAEGITLEDVDGLRYRDFCLGDTGAMFGHSPPAVAAAIAAQAGRGLTCMLPAEATAEVGERLAALFGLPYWQLAQTATEANRSALRWARAITARARILVFHGCYHGTVDETLVRLRGGRTVAREGAIGAPFDNAAGTVAVEFNDLTALEAALGSREIAAVICEPVMTNVGMVLPQPGFHAALRALTRRSGTLLVIDETHTLSSGPGGYTRVQGLEPDLLVCGKAIAGGLPCAVFGFTAEVEAGMRRVLGARAGGHTGMGTTLAANPLALAALRAALRELLTVEQHARMEALAIRLEAGLQAAFARRALPWHVARVGARTEFGFGAAPRNGSEAEAAMRPELEHAMHLWLLNRGLLVTPFHNMMLAAPVATEADIDALVAGIDACLDELRA